MLLEVLLHNRHRGSHSLREGTPLYPRQRRKTRLEQQLKINPKLKPPATSSPHVCRNKSADRCNDYVVGLGDPSRKRRPSSTTTRANGDARMLAASLWKYPNSVGTLGTKSTAVVGIPTKAWNENWFPFQNK